MLACNILNFTNKYSDMNTFNFNIDKYYTTQKNMVFLTQVPVINQ
jgi:hypothetical protein